VTLSREVDGEEESRCLWCGRRFEATPGPGRPRRYCRPSHRQRAYEARNLAATHALRPDQVLMSRERLEVIRDLMYRIESAMDDVDTDLGSDASVDGTRQALWHLYRACAEVRTISLEPLALGEHT